MTEIAIAIAKLRYIFRAIFICAEERNRERKRKTATPRE